MNYNPQYPMFTPAAGYPVFGPPGQPMMDNLAQMRAQQYAPPTAPTPASNAAPQGGMNWVQGEEGAKAFLVAAGNSVLLLDSENPSFYIKSADQSGMPLPLRIFDYSERTQTVKTCAPAPQGQGVEYVPRAEFDALVAQVASLTAKRQRKTQNEEAAANE